MKQNSRAAIEQKENNQKARDHSTTKKNTTAKRSKNTMKIVRGLDETKSNKPQTSAPSKANLLKAQHDPSTKA